MSKSKGQTKDVAPAEDSKFLSKELQRMQKLLIETERQLDSERKEVAELTNKLKDFSTNQMDSIEFMQNEMKKGKLESESLKRTLEELKQAHDFELERLKREMEIKEAKFNSEQQESNARLQALRSEIEQLMLFRDMQANMEREMLELRSTLDKRDREQINSTTSMEKRILQQRNEMKAQLEAKVQEVISNFQTITEERVTKSTKAVLEENQVLRREVGKAVERITTLCQANSNLKQKNMELMEENDILRQIHGKMAQKLEVLNNNSAFLTMKFLLKISNASQIVRVCANREQFKKGKGAMNDIALLENASMVVDNSGKIYAVDTEDNLLKQSWYNEATFDQVVDATGTCIIPGLVDAHTHPVWSGDRVHEWEMKIEGATYMDIHKAGGGIGYTVSQTRSASKNDLKQSFKKRLEQMLSHGTTLVEAKSGYGLETDTEMKMLQVIHEVGKEFPITISSTYLGAHSVPKDKTLSEYAKEVVNVQLPELIRQKNAGLVSPENIDVFHEKGVFESAETEKILLAGREAGLQINFHGDELHPMRSAELAAKVKALAVSHLEEISDEGITKMSENNIFAVLLPTTAYILRIKPPPARQMVDAGVPVALGSDFNPNAFCMSMPIVMHLSCTLMRLSLKEALVASTINSAAALNKSDLHGSLEVGKFADFVIVKHADWRHLIYEFGNNSLIWQVFVRGRLAFTQ